MLISFESFMFNPFEIFCLFFKKNIVSISLSEFCVCTISSDIKISLKPADLTIWPELFSAKLKNQYPWSKLVLSNIAVVNPGDVEILLGVSSTKLLSKGLIK